MKVWVVFKKTCREMLRDWLVLSLSLVFAPFFVWAYWLFTYGGSTSYTILIFNQDQPIPLSDGGALAAGEEAIHAIGEIRYADGSPILKTRIISERLEAQEILRDRGAAAFLIIPSDFSRSILALQGGDRSITSRVVFGGDLANPYYMVGATLAITAVDSYVQQATGQKPMIEYVEEPLGASGARTEFEIYVPGILIFSVIMLIFLAAMTVAHEVEAGTLRRLKITPMTSFDLLGGITLALLLVGVAALLLAFATAVVLGFESQGPLWVAILVGALTSLSVIGMGLVVAAFSHTVSQAFVIANFPMGLLMFFTGAIFPIPKVTLFTLGEYAIGIYDMLPPTHAVVALNKVLTLGVGIEEVIFELCALLLLSVLYFAAGVWLFQRKHLR